ncbi:MAG: glycosyl transferase family 2, partial [Acidimicrobiales bacterium]|nr:glycosyl transferase family 2 [Acidimicrobiales bacterium]
LRRAMRRVYEHQKEAGATGARARADVLASCGPENVAGAVCERLEAADKHPVHVSAHDLAMLNQRASTSKRNRSKKDGRRISSCVVVKDSAPLLSQCLASVRGLADAIVVVEAKPDQDMATVRNDALDQATGGWVLMLDATQTLDPASVDVVRAAVERDEFVGHAAREVHQFGLDGAVSAVERRTAVLFPRHPDLRYVGCVAEQLLPQGRRTDFRLVASPIVLWQHDHRRDRSDPVANARGSLAILERSVREAPDEPFHQYNLGVALSHLGLHDQAEAALRDAIGAAPRAVIWGPAALVSLSRVVAAQGRAAEAVKLCKKATKRAPEWAYGWCVLGGALAAAGRPDEAIRAYMQALDCTGRTWVPAADIEDTAWLVRAGMGQIHLSRGEHLEAAEWLREAVTLNPVNAELRVRLAHAYEAAGWPAEARRHLESAMTLGQAGPGAYAAFGDFFTRRAEEALLRGLADNAESGALLERIERLRAAGATS